MVENSYILIGIHRLVKDLDRETARICAEHGLTIPQFMVMEALLHKGCLTVGEIKETILSSNGTIPVIINNLEKMEMVRRTKDAKDHRKSRIELTEKGRERIEQAYPENERMFSDKFDVWTKEEKNTLIELLAKYHKSTKRKEKP
ncbi:MAG: MarR family transcriptional regulator [Lachnospiraceae bacterium]|nr:MarR family transcriptional regulator [Lachnospiraceae bacterium]